MLTISYKHFAVILMALLVTSCSGKLPSWLLDDDLVLPPKELVEFEPEFEPETIWSQQAGIGFKPEYSQIRPWLQNDAVLMVDNQGHVYSYRETDGVLNWHIELKVPVATGVGGGEQLLLVGTQQGEVIALNEQTGELKWRQRLSSEILVPPQAASSTVVVRTSDGRVTGLSANDGAKIWTYQRKVPLLSLRGDAPLVINDDKILAGYANGKLVALSLFDGKVIWERSVAISRGRTEIDRLVDIDAEPVVQYGMVYTVAYNGNLAAIDVETGRQLWSREMSSRTGLTVDDTLVSYVSDAKDYVWAIEDGSGNGLWRQNKLLRRKITAPSLAGNAVLVGDFDGYLHWLSSSDGRFIARNRIANAAIRTQPVVKDDLIFVSASDGTISAIRVP